MAATAGALALRPGRPAWQRAALGAVAAAEFVTAATQYCPLSAALGVDTCHGNRPTRSDASARAGNRLPPVEMVPGFRIVDGIPMRWMELGHGFPVVLVHGIPTGPSLWRHVTPRVRRARCIAWEMVGYAGSIPAGRGRDLSVARQADYLRAFLRDVGVDRCVLVGHDLGGGVAQILAVRHPDLCAGLVLTNAIAYDSWPIPSVKAMRDAGGLVRLLPRPAARQIMNLMQFRGHDDLARARDAASLHWRPYAQHDGAAALVRQMRWLDVRDTLAVADDLPRLRVPARLVWGAADPFQPIRYARRLARDLQAPLTAVPGGRHFMPEDHPDEIAQAINEVLQEVSHGAGIATETAPSAR